MFLKNAMFMDILHCIRMREDIENTVDDKFYSIFDTGDVELIDELKTQHMALRFSFILYYF